MALKQGNGLHAWEIAVTKKLVGEFRRQSRSLYREEFDDLMQECLLHWLSVRERVAPDPGGPPIGYMARVIRNKLIDLAREREAGKRRGDQETVSLDDTVGESEDAPSFADLVDAEQGREQGDRERCDPIDIQIDVADVIKRLTPEQRRCLAPRACRSKRRQNGSESRVQRSTRKSSASARSSPGTASTTICSHEPKHHRRFAEIFPTLFRGISYE